MILNSSADSFSNELTTNLVCLSDEDEDVLNFEFTFVGVFSVINEDANMDIKHFMKHNSPALIFPYVREHITTITQKTGINPILLQPINILAMINYIKIIFNKNLWTAIVSLFLCNSREEMIFCK